MKISMKELVLKKDDEIKLPGLLVVEFGNVEILARGKIIRILVTGDKIGYLFILIDLGEILVLRAKERSKIKYLTPDTLKILYKKDKEFAEKVDNNVKKKIYIIINGVLDYLDTSALLKNLCLNSGGRVKISVTELSKSYDISRKSTYQAIKKLEREEGFTYSEKILKKPDGEDILVEDIIF